LILLAAADSLGRAVVTQCSFARHMMALLVSEQGAERIGSQEKPNVEHLLI
jgi:hypothetical protein